MHAHEDPVRRPPGDEQRGQEHPGPQRHECDQAQERCRIARAQPPVPRQGHQERGGEERAACGCHGGGEVDPAQAALPQDRPGHCRPGLRRAAPVCTLSAWASRVGCLGQREHRDQHQRGAAHRGRPPHRGQVVHRHERGQRGREHEGSGATSGEQDPDGERAALLEPPGHRREEWGQRTGPGHPGADRVGHRARGHGHVPRHQPSPGQRAGPDHHHTPNPHAVRHDTDEGAQPELQPGRQRDQEQPQVRCSGAAAEEDAVGAGEPEPHARHHRAGRDDKPGPQVALLSAVGDGRLSRIKTVRLRGFHGRSSVGCGPTPQTPSPPFHGTGLLLPLLSKACRSAFHIAVTGMRRRRSRDAPAHPGRHAFRLL